MLAKRWNLRKARARLNGNQSYFTKRIYRKFVSITGTPFTDIPRLLGDSKLMLNSNLQQFAKI